MKFTKRTNYKACPPEETIARIKKLLSEHNISVVERMLPHEEYGCYSCIVAVDDPDLIKAELCTNGKGSTAEYALASGYAEFMERLSAEALFQATFIMTAYRRGDTDYCISPDERHMTAREVFDECGPLLASYCHWDIEDLRSCADSIDPQLTTPCIPFTDTETGSTIYVPWLLLRISSTSNGMCAGNNYHEALAQGISELFERYALQIAYFLEPEIHTLDPVSFSDNEVYRRLENLKNFGFEYQILDMSMGKELPVIGLTLIFGNDKVCIRSFDAGADACAVTALERCFNESFQGTIGAVLMRFSEGSCGSYAKAYAEGRQQEYIDSYFQQLVRAAGELPDCIVYPSTEHSGTFASSPDPTPETDYAFLESVIRHQNWHLLVRDWSRLGFPAYQVWIPEISNCVYPFGMGLETFSYCFEKSEEEIPEYYEKELEFLNNARK